MKKLFWLLSLSLLISGCEYTTQLCSIKKDVGLEGTYTRKGYDFGTFEMTEGKMTVTRVDTGTYRMDDGSVFYTCDIGEQLVAEVVSKFSTFQTFFLAKNGNKVEYEPALFNRTELDQLKIPYTLVDRPGDFRPLAFKHDLFKSLVVDNSSITREQTAKLFRTINIKIYSEKLN